ncbi:MAG: Peptidoglycan-binding lysin domain protein [Myxococcales bacterium]|nr:Peptidoglycan-binding lysin domain protein [Myxococcales bacterium]
MRLLVVAVCLVALTASASARPHKRQLSHEKKRIAKAAHRRFVIRGPLRGQSVGAPWSGSLRQAAQLETGEGYHIRRPSRSYGTRATVEFVTHVVNDVREQFPDTHVLAIGDLSAQTGGAITEHHSHQSGRDADIGLIYNAKPEGYPDSFVVATEANIDPAATLALVLGFAATAGADGGAQVMFLDFDVQGILYRWAKDHEVAEDRLGTLFQYPHRGASTGLVRHEPNHANHLHVRFKCPKLDSACR